MAHLGALSDEFFDFVKKSLSKPPFDNVSTEEELRLSEWLGMWVKSGNAVEACAGKYSVYLQAVIAVVVLVASDAVRQNLRGHRFSLDLGGDFDHPDSLDRDDWDREVFRRKHGLNEG